MNAQTKLPAPNTADISAHLHALFPPAFVHGYPDALVEIAYGPPGNLNRAELFSAFRLDAATDFAVAKNLEGCNVYVGPTLKKGATAPFGRTSKEDFLAGGWLWTEYDGPGEIDVARAKAAKLGLAPGIIVDTGVTPHPRAHVYYKLSGGIADLGEFEGVNRALQNHLGGDPVYDASRVMRLAGTVSYPPAKKIERGYVVEAVKIRLHQKPREHDASAFVKLNPAGSGASHETRKSGLGFDIPRDDDELSLLLGASRVPGKWHKSMLSVIATMIGRGWSDSAIRLACAPYCDGGYNDPDLTPLIEGARAKWNKPNEEQAGPAEKDAPHTDSEAPGPPEPFVPTPWKWIEPKDVSPREFLYGTHYIREFLSVGFGAPGGGKTTRRMVEAVAMASGRALLGVKPVKRLKIWYWNGEDPQSETDRRFAAICMFYGIKREEIEGRLFTDSGREIPIVMAEQSKTGTRIATPVVEGLKNAIRAAGIDVFIADPFVSCHRVTENDNSAIDAVAKRFSDIAGATGCAVDLEHHIRKTNGNEATVDDGRGASSLVGAARAIEVLNKMTKAEADVLGIEQHWRYLCVDDGKANMAPLGERKWFKLESVLLGNGTDLYPEGDSVGVVTNWAPPNHTAGVTGADFDRCAIAIRGGKWREDVRAKDWAGKPVAKALGLDLDSKADKAKVKALLAMWVKAGSLYEHAEYDDEQRRTKKFIRVKDEDE